jgi:uncharacterized protein YbaA (DUF1428 family)
MPACGYVDGFVIPVPNKKIAAYKKMAKVGCKVWMDHGALSYCEGQGDDLAVQFGLPFPKLVNPKKGETIFFSFITYKNKAHRDKVNKAVMKDKRLEAACDPKKMPFDLQRMAYGGFKTLVAG